MTILADPFDLLQAIDPDQLEAACRADWLAAIDDDTLFKACAAMLDRPFASSDSFLMHAPLELMARHRLMQGLPQEARYLARCQMVATAVVYRHRASPPLPALAAEATPHRHDAPTILQAIDAGDVTQAYRQATAWGKRARPQQLLQDLSADWLSRPACGAHAHLFLSHLCWLDQSPAPSAPLAKAAAAMVGVYAQELARSPGLHIDLSTAAEPVATAPAATAATAAARLDDCLRRIAFSPNAQTHGIEPMVLHAVDAGLLTQIQEALPTDDALPSVWQDCFATVLHVPLQSMLVEPPLHARYGWTHALTLPLAAYHLYSEKLVSARQALSMAALFVAAFRLCIGVTPLPTMEKPSSHLPVTHQKDEQQAAQAVIRADAHLVKYVLACRDVRQAFPELAKLCTEAADHLLALWLSDVPAEDILPQLAAR